MTDQELILRVKDEVATMVAAHARGNPKMDLWTLSERESFDRLRWMLRDLPVAEKDAA